MTDTAPTPSTDKQDAEAYANAIKLLAVFSEATNRRAKLQADLDEEYLTAIDDRIKEFAELQAAEAAAEAALEAVAREHPEWFTEDRTIKTPYGSMAMRNTTHLEASDEEASIALIKAKLPADEAAKLVTTKTVLNLSTLADLTDEQLAAYRITRIKGDSFTAKPAKVDLGKAAKKAAKKASQKEGVAA